MEEKKTASVTLDESEQRPAKTQTDDNTKKEKISSKEELEKAIDNLLNYELNGGDDLEEYERLLNMLSDDQKEKYDELISKNKKAGSNTAKLAAETIEKLFVVSSIDLNEKLNIPDSAYREYLQKVVNAFKPVSEFDDEKKALLPYLKHELKKEEYNGATPEDVFIWFTFNGRFLPDVIKKSDIKTVNQYKKWKIDKKLTPDQAEKAWKNAKKAKDNADREKLQKKYNSSADIYNAPYLATYHSQVTDNFLLLEKKNAKQTRQQEISDKATIQTPAGDYRMEISNFSKIKGLSINTHKLFSMGLAGLTAQNNYTHSGKTNNLKLRVNIPLYSYMNRVYPSTIFNKDAADLEKEKNRVDNAVKKARRSIRADINFWRDSRIEWEETIKGKPYKSSGFVNILGAGGINKDYIQLEFTQTIAEYLLKLPINQYATWLLSIDSKKQNAYRIGLKLVQHANMDNNIIKGTADRLKVTTILKTTKLPTFENLQNESKDNRRQWESRIKEPLETALDELQAAGGVSDWQYVKPGGVPLSDDEAENITDYETWANLLIEFTLTDQPDHKERLNRRKEEKAKAARKRTKKTTKKDA